MNVSGARALIIVPRFYEYDLTSRFYVPHFIPMGLAYISSVLKKNGYQTDVLNLNLCEGPVDSAIQRALSQKEFKFMLTGGLSTHYSAVWNCVSAVRQHSRLARIVLGGGLVSSQPELIFRALRPDYLVIGEGESSVVDLLNYVENDMSLSEVDGIGYGGPDGELVLTKSRKAIQDIDSIPWPDLDGIGLDTILEQTLPSQTNTYDLFDYPRPYPLVASRSCPFLCSFCFHPTGNKYRQRSIPNIMAELAFALTRYRVNIIDIYDELFSYNKQRVLEFCKEIKQLSRTVPWEVTWNCQMRVDTTDEELIEAMREAGCYTVSLGLESYSDAVLKSMNKRITPKQIDRTLRIAQRLNMGIQGNFIFGDRAETVETAKETLDYWKENHDLFGDAISLGFINPYPGTALYNHCLRKSLITDELDFVENHIFDPINMSDTMSDREFRQLQSDLAEAAIAQSKYTLPSKIKRADGGYEVHARCPYCKTISVYRNYVPPIRAFDRRAIACRSCRMRFFLVSPFLKKYSTLRRVAYKMIGPKGVSYLRQGRRVAKDLLRYVRQGPTMKPVGS